MNTQHDAPVQVETPILTLRRQGRALVLPVLVLIVLAAVSGYFIGTLSEPWMNVSAAIAAAVLAVLLGIGPVLAWLTNRVTITNRRVIMRRGVLVQHRSEISLSRVREVRSRRSLVQRMFGSGDIELLVGAESPGRMRDVPGVATVIDALQQLIEQNYLSETAMTAVQPEPQALPGLSSSVR